LKQIEHTNIKIRSANGYKSAKRKVELLKTELSDIDDKINKVDTAKKERIINCKFPIDGLAIDEDMVLYQGQPFSQLSTGQQIRISTAIAMALNPTLKIILIREGSLLDKEGLKTLIDFAKEKDFQLWLEKVGDEKGVGIYIEDGQVVDVAKQPNLL
jgi:ABC-type glutathione transport system ATPase component